MKRADLTAGTDYAASPSNEWTAETSYRRAQRVRVLDTRAWVGTGRTYGGALEVPKLKRGNGEDFTMDGHTIRTFARLTKDGKGQNVLVQQLNDDGTPDGYAQPMPTREIRATWEEGAKALAAADQARAQRKAEKADAQDHATEVHQRLAKLATAQGIHLSKPTRHWSGEGPFTYTLTVDALAALLEGKA